MPPAIAHIVDRHVEDAAFLWLQRQDACSSQPHYRLADLVVLDNRLDANLDGVAVAGSYGLETATRQALHYQTAGEVFVASWSAIRHLNGKVLDQMIALAEQSDECWQALVSAMAWHSPAENQPFLQKMTNSNDLKILSLAVEVNTQQGQPSEALLTHLFKQSDSALLQVGVKAVGQLQLVHWLEKIRPYQAHEDLSLQFWANWSATLLGDSTGLSSLKREVMTAGQFSQQAIRLLACVMPGPVFNDLIRTLFSQPESRLMALSGAGYSGDPLWVNGLIKYMDDPELARRAGEAFSMITGADLAYLDLDRDWPEEVATGPSESATDDNVTLDPDESTPWPDSEKIAVWWQQQQRHFTQGQSYLDGKSISVQSCQQVLRTAFQRQRRQAALRLAMLGQPFFAVDSPAKRQMASLHQMLND